MKLKPVEHDPFQRDERTTQREEPTPRPKLRPVDHDPFAQTPSPTKQPSQEAKTPKKEPKLKPVNFDPFQEQEDDYSYLEAAGRNLKGGYAEMASGLGTVSNYLGERFDSDTLRQTGESMKDYWGEVAESAPLSETAQESPFDDPKVLADPRWWTENVSRMAPSFAIPAGVAGGGMKIASKALPGLPRVASALGAGVGGLFGGALEGAQTYEAGLESGQPEETAASAGEAMALGSAVLNALPFYKIMNPSARGVVYNFLTRGMTEGVTEAMEEPLDEAIQGLVYDKEMDWEDVARRMAHVAPPAFLLGGATGGGQGATQPAPQTPEDADISGTVEDSIEDADLTGDAQSDAEPLSDVQLAGEDQLATQMEQAFPGERSDNVAPISGEEIVMEGGAPQPQYEGPVDEEIEMYGYGEQDVVPDEPRPSTAGIEVEDQTPPTTEGLDVQEIQPEEIEATGLTADERQRAIQALEQELEPQAVQPETAPSQPAQEGGRAVQSQGAPARTRGADRPTPAPEAQQAEKVARKGEKPQKQAESAGKSRQGFDPTRDSITEAVAKLGGINRDDVGGDLNEGVMFQPDKRGRKQPVKAPGTLQPIVRAKGGMTLDGMAENLSQFGYPVTDETGAFSRNALIDAINEEAAGRPVYSSQRGPESLDAELEEAARSYYGDEVVDGTVWDETAAEMDASGETLTETQAEIRSLIPKAMAIDEGAAETALERDTDAEALKQLQEIINGQQEVQASRQAVRPEAEGTKKSRREEQQDAVGGQDDTALKVRQEREKRAEAQRKAPPMDEGEGDLFSDKSKQQDVEDVTKKPAKTESKPTEKSAPQKSQKAQKSEKGEKQDRIEDFGQRLEGARKHYAQKLKDAESVDIAAEPLSKSWPEPNYQQLLDEGIDPWTVAFVHAARDEVPRKPTKRFKLKRWVDQVQALRSTAENMLSHPETARQAQESLREHPVLEPVKRRTELYQAVGHDKSLKGIQFGVSRYSMLNGEKFDTPKEVWEVTKAAKATAFSNMPRVIAKGDTKEEAIENFKQAVQGGQLDQSRTKNVRFDIYSRRNEPGVVRIGKKVGRDYVDLETFDSAKEAREYLNNNQAALEKKLAKMKEIPDHRKESNSPRVGVDHRNGADVTPEQFTETFGFRGVQFGNYVEGGRRQQDLNETYDALMDLAGILNLPAKALSLNGELGLAFGARGKGGKRAAKAHFEPDNIVINLTKRSGAGSLAHEWFHSLDNYFARQRGERVGYLTESAEQRGEGVRPEMVEAFKNVKQTINRTRLKQRSRQLDKTRSKPYWSTGREMSARSFESYVIEKLRDQGGSNDYLANIVSEDYWNAAAALGMEKEGTYPYPEAAEVPEIRAAFDNFFQTVETRETDQGVGMFAMAYHGSPYRFDRFDISKIGTGEGAAAFGHGIYLAENPQTAEIYAQNLGFTEIEDLGIGSVMLYRNGQPVDYSPRTSADRDTAKALLQETMLVNEWEMKQAFEQEGADGVAKVMRRTVEDLKDQYAEEHPPYGKYFDQVARQIDQGVMKPKVKMQRNEYRYTVDIPDSAVAKMLDWDKPLSEQPKAQAAFEALAKSKGDVVPGKVSTPPTSEDPLSDILSFPQILFNEAKNGEKSGGEIYKIATAVMDGANKPQALSEALNEAGIPGIKYLDQGSRTQGEGTRNFVVFDDSLITILERNGEPVTGAEREQALASMRSTGRGTGMTTEAAHNSLRQILGKKAYDRLVASGRFEILRKPSEVVEGLTAKEDANVKGRYDPDQDKSYLFADNIAPDELWGVFLHEVGAHYGLPKMIGWEEYNRVTKQLQNLYKLGNKRVVAAYNRVPKNTPQQYQWDEVLAYLAQEKRNHNMGLVRRVIAKIKEFLRSRGYLKAGKLSPDEITRLVVGAATHAARTAPKSATRGAQEGTALFSKEESPEQKRERLRRLGMDFEDLPGDLEGNPTQAQTPEDVEPETVDAETARKQLKDRGMFSMAAETDERNRGTIAHMITGEEKLTFHPSTQKQNKLKRYLKRYFTKEGLLTKEAFARHIESQGIKQEDELVTQFMVDGVVKAARKAYKKSWSKISDADKAKMNEYLAGNSQVDLPATVKSELDNMRTSLDGLSGRVQQMLIDEIMYRMYALNPDQRAKAMDLIQKRDQEITEEDLEGVDPIVARKVMMYRTIEGNKRQYLNRSYAVFDNENWVNEVADDVKARARDYLRQQVENDAKLSQMSNQAKEDYVEGVMNKILQPKGRDLMSFMNSSQLGQKDLSIMKRRKDIAPEIRELMGEYKDPRVNYSRSVGKMSYLVANHHFLRSVREDGLGVFLTAKPSGNMSEEVTSWDENKMAPLAGLYTSPEFAQALRDAAEPANMPTWLKNYMLYFNVPIKYGKAQPLDAVVHTPTGPTRMGDISIGDVVCGAGTKTTVTGVYPQGTLDVYKLTFCDGSTTRASGEHLWEVIIDNKSRVMTTQDLLDLPKRRIETRQIAIPVDKAEFEAQPTPLEPYMLGAILGDGGLTGSMVRLSNPDSEVVERIREALPEGYVMESPPSWADIDYAIKAENFSDAKRDGNAVRNALDELGLMGHKSLDKFIPGSYKRNSEAVRMELMRGLLDTDGTVSRVGQPIFNTPSSQLAKDVRELAESLGASVLCSEQRTASGNTGYELNIRVHDARQWFHLSRKRDKASPRKKPLKRTIRSIEHDGQEECQCISVDDPRSLYMTDRFILTHNTVISPTTTARNFLSASMFTIMNGHFNWSHAVKAASHTWADLGSSNPKKMDYLRKLVRLGVLHDNPRARELREALDEAADMNALEGSVPARALKSTLNAATKIYRAGDDFWKIIGFENTKADLMRAGMDETQAEAMSADRIRNGYPTYSMVPAAIRGLRRFPVTGTFVSFPWEIMRTTSHQFRFLREDWNAGRKSMAAKRAMGMATAGGIAHGISMATMAMLGLDDEDDEAIRQMAPEWQQNAQLAYLPPNEDGQMRYLDLSHLDPYTYLKVPFTAMANGNYEGLDEAAIGGMQEFMEPFLGTEIGFGALMEIWNNNTEYGPVYDESAPWTVRGKQMFEHARKQLQPGIASNVERTVKAWNDIYTSYGKKYELTDEALAWGGLRISTMTPEISLRFRSFEFNDQASDASKPTYRVFRDPNVGAYKEVPDAVEQSKGRWRRAFKDMHASIRAARKIGMSDAEIAQALRQGGVAGKHIGPLLRGRVPTWRPYQPTLNDARQSILRSRDRPKEKQALMQDFSKRRQKLNQHLNQ